MTPVKTLIIGAGSIGAMKPNKYDSPEGENILTHAHACIKHPQIDLVGLCDINSQLVFEVTEKWNTVGYFNWPDAIRDTSPELIILATPTETHAQLFNLIATQKIQKPKAIIIEKPVGMNMVECDYIHNVAKKAGIPVIVNFTRRFEVRHQEICKVLSCAKKIYSCRVIYTRGLMHEGCHALDLMNWFFGKYRSSIPLEKLGAPICDRSITDQTYPVYASYENCPQVIFTPVDGREYAIFEVDIVTSEFRYRLIDHGLFIESSGIVPEPVYGDYNTMGYFPERDEQMIIKTQLQLALLSLLDNAYQCIRHKKAPLCSIEDAFNVHKVYKKITFCKVYSYGNRKTRCRNT